ncbi:Uncharacterized protein SCF082_LOCUS32328 [Durusdinium trenchii]|uniref:Uncharacterized protein n=1 Tax=Durusdinium trenchii TaxID=1381693 RepID=A0ABP0NDP4_9DINO
MQKDSLTLADLPESSLIEALCALPLRDTFGVTACDKKLLFVGFSAAHLPAIEDDAPLPLSFLPLLQSRFPKLQASVLAHLEGDWLPRGKALKLAGALVRKLVVRLSESVGESELLFILKSCPSLYRFELTDYDLVGEVTGEFLQHLPSRLRELRLCLLRSLQDENLRAAIEAAPGLQSVSLEGNDALTSNGMVALANLRLQELILVCTRAGSVSQITEEMLMQILEAKGAKPKADRPIGTHTATDTGGSFGLQALEVSERAGPPLQLTEGGVHVMTALGKHRVRSLSLSGVVGLGDKALCILGKACPALKELILYRPGNQLSSAGLQQALECFSSLESLSLGCVADFSGAFKAVCSGGHRLKTLEMTRYFRTAAEVSLVSVVRALQSAVAFPTLRTAFFRGTFSAEQVAACHLTMDLQPNASLQVQWSQLDEQTFGVDWCHDGEQGEQVCVHLQRCFREGEFI